LVLILTISISLGCRPSLTWRDVHDIFRKSAVPVDLANPAAKWTLLPSGYRHSDQYGYGKVNVQKAIAVAKTHVPLRPFLERSYPLVYVNSLFISNKLYKSFLDIADTSVSIERIAVTVWMAYPVRGELQLAITSPAGIVSILSRPRPHDTSSLGLTGFTFHSVRHWGESARGRWTLSYWTDTPAVRTGTFTKWGMEIYGAST
jgi:kexin